MIRAQQRGEKMTQTKNKGGRPTLKPEERRLNRCYSMDRNTLKLLRMTARKQGYNMTQIIHRALDDYFTKHGINE